LPAHLDLAVSYDDGQLVVTVEDNGSDRGAHLAALADRVGAVGGNLLVRPSLGRVEIPCASL